MTSGVVDTVVPGGDVDVFAVVVDEVDVEVLVVVVDVVEDCVVVTVVVSVTGLGFARVMVTAVPTSMRPGSGDCLMTVPSGSSLRAVSVTTGSEGAQRIAGLVLPHRAQIAERHLPGRDLERDGVALERHPQTGRASR